MLVANHLSFSYTPERAFYYPSFSCADGETLLILGNSGTGKTTLLHLLALLLNPQGGSFQVQQKELVNLSASEAGKFRAENLGIIYQKPHFVASLNVMDNLLLANYLADKSLDKKKVKELAASLGIEGLLQKNIMNLSGGEQQRVSIVRALMNRPQLILADEPTSNLDDENCEKVHALLEEQSKNIGASLIIVTHDQRLKKSNQNIVQLQSTNTHVI